MNPWPMKRRRMLLALAAVALAPSAGAAAHRVSAADAKRVRAVIEAQLAAFAADDAKRAFALAAPAIRAQFGSAERFVAMVQASYPVVYRPASVAFLQAERMHGEIVQGVQLTDDAGRGWLAVYHMQRQRDRSWRIGGCELLERQGRST